jgi:UDP-N-acetyl-D-mannosaminuronic acid dehydrogenase
MVLGLITLPTLLQKFDGFNAGGEFSMLAEQVVARTARIGVVGLGYVGLPVACEFARAGFNVVGIDVKAQRVSKINAGESPIEGDEPGLQDLLTAVISAGRFRATTDYTDLQSADIVTINVETPVSDVDHRPDYSALKSACTALGAVLKLGALVIIESTVAPGTSSTVVIPTLELASGRKVNIGFFVGACPERVMPGKLLNNLRTVSRVCGVSDPGIGDAMHNLYSIVTTGDVDITDVVTAELVKTAENTYRDVNIAFANEVALICEDVGADVYKVRDLVNKSPGRLMLMPGAGVGGHCIPKDPWLLASAAKPETPIRLIAASRLVNESMPGHVLALLQDALVEAGSKETRAKILVLGYSYLADSDDTRHSPSATLVALLNANDFVVTVHDPWVEGLSGDVEALFESVDAAVLMVAHQQYQSLDLSRLCLRMRLPIFIDGRGVFSIETKPDIVFRGIGKGKRMSRHRDLPSALEQQ